MILDLKIKNIVLIVDIDKVKNDFEVYLIMCEIFCKIINLWFKCVDGFDFMEEYVKL